MHVHQQQSQTCKPGKPPALREVKHPHKGRTSVSRFPLAKQGISSQYSSYFEGIGHFPRDPCKPYLKSDLQLAIHASQKQEKPLQVNTEKVNTQCVHSYRMEHAEHFPAPMEMCMDDHHTQTTERTQWQHLLPDFTCRHAEFPSGMESAPNFPGKQILQGNETFTVPGMENTPAFLGNQFQQENEKTMDTGTFTLGNTILNRYPACSTHTQLKMENSNMEAFPSFNFYADATPQMETSRKGPRADSTPSGKDTTVTSSRVTPMDPMDDIHPPTRKCISQTSVHFQDSLSNQFNWLLKSKVQGNQLTGLSHQFNTDLHWTCTGVKCKAINSQDPATSLTQTSVVMRREMTEIFTEAGMTGNSYPILHWTLPVWPPSRHTNTDTQRKKPTFFQDHQNSNHLMHQKSTFFQDHWRQWHTSTQRKKPTFFQDHQNSNRLMNQKLRSSTQVQQPRQEYSRFTETEKAKFQNPFIYNDDRNFVWHNSVDKFSPNLVYLTKSDTSSDSIF